MSVGKSQILSSRRLLANLKYYQADDVTSHKRLSYLERLCFTIPCFRIVFGGDSSSMFVVDRDFPGSNPTPDNYFHFLFFCLNSAQLSLRSFVVSISVTLLMKKFQ